MNDSASIASNLQVDNLVESCVDDAWSFRRSSTRADWRAKVLDLRAEESCRLAHRDPYTFHAYSRPRGYPGDAELLDYIYRKRELPPSTKPDGAQRMRFTLNAPAPRAVRWRRRFLARMIDETAGMHGNARVLSIAAGHLREAELSVALVDGKIGEIVARDQDAESLRMIERDYGHFPIRTVEASVRYLIVGKSQMGRFHLVYAAGLFDYLDDAVGGRLVARMWAMTHHGGA